MKLCCEMRLIMNENDRRTRRTQRLIRENFIDLMSKKPITTITIKEITDRADINRRTFYLHYTDIYDLLHRTEDYIMEHFSQILSEFEIPDDKEVIGVAFFKVVMQYINENQKMLGILCRNPDSKLMAKLIELTVNNGKRVIPFIHPEDAEYILNYCCWGMVGVLHISLRQENFDTNKLANLADKLLLSTLEVDRKG